MSERRPTHLNEAGEAHMVDVGSKPETRRLARAAGQIRMAPETLEAIRAGTLEKGEALTVARIAGIQAAKRTHDLIPLCHALPGVSVEVHLSADPELPGIRVEAEARLTGRTGVEMEALAAVSAALLTLYDMAKALDRGMVISDVRLLQKEGGASGSWQAPELNDPSAAR
jgi:cyclic pyranopterin phosphate synthase